MFVSVAKPQSKIPGSGAVSDESCGSVKLVAQSGESRWRFERAVEVSVVIPCRNAARYLARQLEALANQAFKGTWEVVLVDNGSSDPSRLVAESFSNCLNMQIVDAPERPSPAYARNIGARAAAGDKLLFVDADDEVEKGYVSAMTSALDSHEFVTGRVDTRSLNPEWVRLAHGPPWGWDGPEDWFGFLPATTSCSMGVRRSTFESVGGFPEDYPGASSEDLAFCWRLQVAGTALHFVPDAVLRYRYRDSLPDLFRQVCTWGYSLPFLYREFRAVGMPGRSFRTGVREWVHVLRQLSHARMKAELAPLVVRFAYCVGRLAGSVRHRVLYL